jgi:hypothetical protein
VAMVRLAELVGVVLEVQALHMLAVVAADF